VKREREEEKREERERRRRRRREREEEKKKKKKKKKKREREKREETPAATFSPPRLDVTGCGALSEPKKNFGFPEAAAHSRAALSAVVLAIGLQ